MTARVQLKRSNIRVDRWDVPLSPGMAVRVEISNRRLCSSFAPAGMGRRSVETSQ
jgi:hypothetical protein